MSPYKCSCSLTSFISSKSCGGESEFYAALQTCNSLFVLAGRRKITRRWRRKKKRKWRKQKGRSSTDAALHHLRTRFRRCYSLPEWSSYWQANYQRAAGGRWRAQIDASLRPAHTFIAVANSPMPLHRQFLLECQRTKKWNNEGRWQHQQPSSSLNDWQTSSSIRLPIPEIINSISHQRL